MSKRTCGRRNTGKGKYVGETTGDVVRNGVILPGDKVGCLTGDLGWGDGTNVGLADGWGDGTNDHYYYCELL